MKNSFSFLAKHISWKYIVLILILIYIILLTVPYLPHKTVSEEYKEKDAALLHFTEIRLRSSDFSSLFKIAVVCFSSAGFRR